MSDHRIAIAFVIIWAAVLGALAVTRNWTALWVVAVIGGPVSSVLWWLTTRQSQA